MTSSRGQCSKKPATAAAIGFSLGELLTLGSLFWGLNLFQISSPRRQ